LSRLQGQAAADIILERYESDNLEDYLTVALSLIDPEKAAKALIAALSSPHIEARISAAEALIANPHEETIFALTSAVETYLNQSTGQQSGVSLVTEDALASAVRALGAIKSPMSVPLLRKVITKEGSTRLRATAVASLSNHMVDSLVPMIQALLKDPDARVRANAIEALQCIDKPAIIGMLQPYLYDSHQRVRANAAKAIWKYGDYDVTSTLKEMLGHKEKAQRVSGIYAIGEIKADTFVKNLLAYLKDPDADVRRNAVIALKKFGKRDFSMDLIALIDDPVPDIRVQAAAALAEVFQGSAQAQLLKRFSVETESAVRCALIGHLGHIGTTNALPSLMQALYDQDERVVITAIETIGRLQNERPATEMVQKLMPFLAVKSRQIRARAIRVLWQWGCQEVLTTILDMLGESSVDNRLSALDILGELFAEISRNQLELRQECEACLQAAADHLRQDLKKKTNSELETQIEGLWKESSTHIQNSDFDQARSILEHLLTLEPNHLQALIQLGEIYLRDKDDFQAESCFTKALELNSNTVKAHYCLGQIFHGQQDWERASKSLQTAIRLYPKLPQAYLWLADALEGISQ
ncbi:MAG TPA: HEAT repeat domain-containing protein, partial [Candidatus Ozemobacteraceae bacterium]|nr:HEAT repeat domain-containing protein [Candidatus Ozemobacteraceae bacterium]